MPSIRIRPDRGRAWAVALPWALVAVIMAGPLLWMSATQPNAVSHTRPSGLHTLPLRLLTYNIQHGADADHRLDLAGTLREIAKLAPDVAIIQEVDIAWARSGGVDEPRLLAGAGRFAYSYFAQTLRRAPQIEAPVLGSTPPPARYGILLLSRYPLHDIKVLQLPQRAGYEPRVLLAASVQTPAGALHIFGTHLSTHTDERYAQIKAIVEHTQDAPTPRVLLGDLNARPGSAALAVLSGFHGGTRWWDAGRLDEQPALTYPAGRPTARLDYILVSRDLLADVKDVWVDAARASDHRPLIVDLSLPVWPWQPE